MPAHLLATAYCLPVCVCAFLCTQTALAQAAGVLYNFSGSVSCLSPGTGPSPESDEDAHFWDFQWCTEMVMPASRDGGGRCAAHVGNSRACRTALFKGCCIAVCVMRAAICMLAGCCCSAVVTRSGALRWSCWPAEMEEVRCSAADAFL